jgi:hypothetical protein
MQQIYNNKIIVIEMLHLDGLTDHLVVPFAKSPTNAQGSCGFY